MYINFLLNVLKPIITPHTQLETSLILPLNMTNYYYNMCTNYNNIQINKYISCFWGQRLSFNNYW